MQTKIETFMILKYGSVHEAYSAYCVGYITADDLTEEEFHILLKYERMMHEQAGGEMSPY